MKPVAAGHVTHDLVDGCIVPGGSAWYGARAWREQGLSPTLVTAVGADFAHDAALDGLGAVVTRGGETTRFVNTYPEGRPREMRVEAVAPPVEPPDGLTCDLLLLAPVAGEIALDAWRGVSAGRAVAGLQGWIKRRDAAGRASAQPGALDPAGFAWLDAVTLSEEDLAGDEAWLRALCAAVPTVALTRGELGCTVYSGGAATDISVEPVRGVSPTGAGDVFAARFALACWAGADPVTAARKGCAAATGMLASRLLNRRA